MSFKALALCMFFHMQDPQDLDIKKESIDIICKQSDNIIKFSELHNIKYEIVVSIIWNESRFQPDRISNHNACGLMQIIPRWSIGKYTCNELKNPIINIEEGVKLLSKWRDEFGRGSIEKGLCGYAAGYNCSSNEKNAGKLYSKKIIKMSKKLEKKIAVVSDKIKNKNTLYNLFSNKYNINL